MEEEQWKDIKGYEGIYQISNKGILKGLAKEVFPSTHPWRIRKYPERIIKLVFNKRGYAFFVLKHNLIKRKATIHRLVAEAFIPNPENKPQVNHKDGDKLNNAVENLEWATCKENMVHARRNGLFKCGENSLNAKLTNSQAAEIRNSKAGTLSLSQKYGVTQTIIINIRQNKTYMPTIYFGDLPSLLDVCG